MLGRFVSSNVGAVVRLTADSLIGRRKTHFNQLSSGDCGYCTVDREYFDGAVLDKGAVNGWMCKMRTEPASSGCGGAVAYSQPGILTNKSQQDVEAAFAIAQLSEQAPHGDSNCRELTRSDSRLTNGTASPPKFNHLRTAVMPFAYSRVEKATAVKRRLDSRDDRDSDKVARLQDVASPVEKAIASERGSFMTARRHPYLPPTHPAGETEPVGRFVRTCAPSGREEVPHRLYVATSDPTVSPTLVKSIPSLLATSGVSRMVPRDEKPPVLTPAVAVPSVSQRQRCDNSDLRHLWHTRRTTTLKHPAVLPQGHHISVPSTGLVVPVSYNDSLQKLHGRDTFKSSSYADSATRRRDGLSLLASAYYNLGQMAAAAAASQPLHPASDSRVQRTRVRQLQRPARVDSRTLSKVCRGEFGVLSTLRRYCSQLRRRSEPSDVVKQPADCNNDVAMDLSIKKSEAAESQSDVVTDAEWYSRTTRSCESSPSLGQTEVPARRWTVGQLPQRSAAVQHQLSSFSLPSSPYITYDDSEHHRGNASAAASAPADDGVTERTDGDAAEVPDLIPDSQLPLKKRRLHYPHQQPVISDDKVCDQQWTSETTTHG